MRSRFGWALVALLGTYGCFDGGTSGNGNNSSIAPEASSVNVINCSNYNISVFSRKNPNGAWKHHGFTGTGKTSPASQCNLNIAGVINADIGIGSHKVRIVYEDNCNAGLPNGPCIEEERNFEGVDSAPIRDFKTTKL